MLRPTHKRYIRQILPFPVIWLLSALVYSFLEFGLLGDLDYYPSTGNHYDFLENLSITAFGCILVGLLQGCLEVLWLRKLFLRMTLWVKIALKILFYLLFIILFLALLSTLNSLFNFSGGDWGIAIAHLGRFIGNFAFFSVIIYVGATLFIALLISEISQYLGDGVLLNFLFGRYHRPKEETRIFMFLDMKSSTAIAEDIGHKLYFELLKEYYADMTTAILETLGQIYQYVGDEIVVSWSKKEGIYKNNCIRCFSKINNAIEQRREFYTRKFGLVPQFKAGFHIGEVTIGEIGIIKKDIIYTGDILNTTARIQAECNTHNSRALISEALLQELQKEDPISFHQIGEMTLRGKSESIKLYSVLF